MSKKMSVALATTGVTEKDLPVALAVYIPDEPSLSTVFTFKHNKPSHPVALSIHKFTQDDCPVSLKAQLSEIYELFGALGTHVYCYNAFFALSRLTAAIYLEPAEPISGHVFPFSASWHCVMDMSEAHFVHERNSDIDAGAISKSPKFTEILKRLEIDDKGLYQDDAKEALMQRAILNYEIVKRIEARRQEFLASLIL